MALRLAVLAAGATSAVASLPPLATTQQKECAAFAQVEATSRMTPTQKAVLESQILTYSCQGDVLACRVEYLEKNNRNFAAKYAQCVTVFDGGVAPSCEEIAGPSAKRWTTLKDWFFGPGIGAQPRKVQFAMCQKLFGPGKKPSQMCMGQLDKRFSQSQTAANQKCYTQPGQKQLDGQMLFGTSMTRIPDPVGFLSTCTTASSGCDVVRVGTNWYQSTTSPSGDVGSVVAYEKAADGSFAPVPTTLCWDTFVSATPAWKTKVAAQAECQTTQACLGVAGNDRGSGKFYLMQGTKAPCSVQFSARRYYSSSQQSKLTASCKEKVYTAVASSLQDADQRVFQYCLDIFPDGPRGGCWGIGTTLFSTQIDEVETKCGEDPSCFQAIITPLTKLTPVTTAKHDILKRCQARAGCIYQKALTAAVATACIGPRACKAGEEGAGYKAAYEFGKKTEQQQLALLNACDQEAAASST